jgi:hypothetical protein
VIETAIGVEVVLAGIVTVTGLTPSLNAGASVTFTVYVAVADPTPFAAA